MSTHAALSRQEDSPLRLVYSRPASWIANATLADTRAYVEDIDRAWRALATLSVPDGFVGVRQAAAPAAVRDVLGLRH